jgi:4-hydroxy-tetrahydrodipicolinate synthase
MQALKGSLVALVTPLSRNGEIDYDALQNLLDWHVEQGTDGIVSVGTTGESATLNPKEHIDVINFTVKHINNRLPVIAGTGANSTEEAIELSEESRLKGADYVLLVTPYYNKPNQNGLIAHYEKIAETVQIKQILYNVPSRTSCDLLPTTIEFLSEHKNIIGIKEAVDTENRIKDLLKISKSTNNFVVFSGDDPTFCNALNLGCKGVISVVANIIPRQISEICDFALSGSINHANTINDVYSNLYRMMFVESNPIPVKWALFKMNLINNSIRLPLTELDGTFQDELLSELIKLEII